MSSQDVNADPFEVDRNDVPPQSASPQDSQSKAPVEPVAVDRQQARTRCVEKYVASATSREDPLAACLGMLNADVMEVAFRYNKTLQQALSEGAGTLEDMRRLSPSIDAYLRVMKQTDRFCQMDIRLRETLKQKNDSQIEVQMFALKQLATKGSEKTRV